MDVIFCLSNLFVPHTLTLVKGSDRKVLVYTDQEGMYKFFTGLGLKNVEIFYRKDLKIRRDLSSAIRIVTKRNEILKWLLEKNPQRIYFFHNTFGDLENWLIKKLSKKSQLVHIPVFNELPFQVNYNVRSILGILKNYFVHGILTEPLWEGKDFRYKLPESFFIKYHIEKIELEIDDVFINEVITKKFNLINKKIVLLTGSVVETGQVEESEYVKKINNLINFVGKEKIIAKPHPRFPNRYGLEKELDLIPYYIPANVLYSIFSTFIGYSTTTLSEAAERGLVATSTLDYFDSTNEEKTKHYKEYINVNKKSGEIHYFTDLGSINIK